MPEPLAAETLDDEQRRLLLALTAGPRAGFLASERSPGGWPLPGPFGPMLLGPAVSHPLQELGLAVRYRGRLSDARRELAIVATAAACHAPYELDHHMPLARAAGVPEELLAAAMDPDGTRHDGSGIDGAIVEACRRLARDGELGAALVAELEGELGRAETFELLVLAGYYRLLATVLSAYGID